MKKEVNGRKSDNIRKRTWKDARSCVIQSGFCSGVDADWSIGTELRQLLLQTPEMNSPQMFRSLLVDDVLRRHYVIDADVEVCQCYFQF